MPNVAFVMMVFNGDHVLEPCMKAIMPYGPVYVAEGPVEYYQRRGFTTSTDRTNEILGRLLPTANVIHGQWPEKDEMQRATERLIPEGTTHVWVVDSDEIYRAADIERVLGMLDHLDSVAFSAVSFFAGFDRYMTGFEESFDVHRIQRWHHNARWATHRPPTVLAPDCRPYREHRHLSARQTAAMGLRMYHYSYTFPSQAAMKGAYYEDRGPGMVIPNWYRRVWLPWARSSTSAGRGVIEL